jgi:hypothetical protein
MRPITQLPTTPTIAVAIGRQSRIYHAFVTTAPAALDGPSTMTLYASTLADVAGFAADRSSPREMRRARPPGSCSLTPVSSCGTELAIASPTASVHRLIPCSSARQRSSTGSGSAFKRPRSGRQARLWTKGRSGMRIRSVRESPIASRSRLVQSLPDLTSAITLSEAQAARYIAMSPAWLKKSRTHRFRGVTDAPPFVRCGARRIAYRREDLDAWQRRHVEYVGAEPG